MLARDIILKPKMVKELFLCILVSHRCVSTSAYNIGITRDPNYQNFFNSIHCNCDTLLSTGWPVKYKFQTLGTVL